MATNGITPLHLAALGGDTDCAEATRLLLAAGANPNAAQQGGWTPLHIAAEHGDIEVVRLLIAAPSRVNAVSESGRSPLFQAAAFGHATVAEELIRAKAELECKDALGETPLLIAALNGNAEVCRVLLQAGAPFDTQDESGETALGAALKLADVRTAKVLVNAGADYPTNASAADDRFHVAIYQKVLADKQAAEGAHDDARASYSTALASFTTVRKDFADQVEANIKKTKRKIFWANAGVDCCSSGGKRSAGGIVQAFLPANRANQRLAWRQLSGELLRQIQHPDESISAPAQR